MFGRRLSEDERRAVRDRIESVGQWLREGEPARTVEEDLLGHELRTQLCALLSAARVRSALHAAQRKATVERIVFELYAARLERERS